MKNSDAKHLLREIEKAISRRKRPPYRETMEIISLFKTKVEAGMNFDKAEDKMLLAIYERFTDPKRIKWGTNARPA